MEIEPCLIYPVGLFSSTSLILASTTSINEGPKRDENPKCAAKFMLASIDNQDQEGAR